MRTQFPATIRPIDYDRLDPQLVKAARGMEANFLKQMVRSMRNSVPESEESKNNKGLQLFRGMLDDTYAESAAGQGGIGIADLIIRHLLDQSNVAVPEQAVRPPVAEVAVKESSEPGSNETGIRNE